ncbi:13325_t:CDS:1, partial [Acaulospora morrowiae]
ATIEPQDDHNSVPTHIFDLVLLNVDSTSLKSRFRISSIENLQSPKIIARKLGGTERWETIQQNAYINLEFSWNPIVDSFQPNNVSIHVFSPHDIRHEVIYISKGVVDFKIDFGPESTIRWDSPVDDNSTITVSMEKEYTDFQSVSAMVHVEEVIVNSGVLLTAIEEMRKDEVTNVVLEDSY